MMTRTPRSWSKKTTLVSLRLCTSAITTILILMYPPVSGLSTWLWLAWGLYIATTAGCALMPIHLYGRRRFDLTFIAVEMTLLGGLFAIYGGAETWFFYPLFLLVVLLAALARRLGWALLLGAGVSGALVLIMLDVSLLQPGVMVLQIVTLLTTAGVVGFLTEELDREEITSVQFENAFEVSSLLAEAIDVRTVYQRLTEVLARMFNAGRVAVILTDGNGSGHVVSAVDENRAVDGVDIDLELYPEIRVAMDERRTIVIDRPDKNPRMRSVHSRLPSQLKGTSMLVTPIRRGDDVRGVLFIRIDNAYHRFTDQEIRFCRLMADIAGKALRRADHFEQVSEAARRDPLTGLYNVRALRKKLRNEIARCERSGDSCSLLMIDVDYLKPVNDTYGHQAGDLVLRNLAKVLTHEVREVDVVARYGGEEFAVVLFEADGRHALEVAERLRQRAHRMRHGPVREAVTVSIGIATYPGDAESTESLIRAADEALYCSKHRGRNRSLRYGSARLDGNDKEEPSPPPQTSHDALVVQSLRRALKGVESNRSIVRNTGAIASLATLMCARDPAALERIEDAATLSRLFLGSLDMGDREKSVVHLACLLRDLGKLAVDTEILNSWDLLTREERDAVREHPIIGAQTVATLRGLDAIVPIVRHHHERWDGAGYPDGLEGDAIPYGARVVGLIDALQAMLFVRPGSDRGHGFEYARQEILDGSGTQFDPDLAARLVVVMDAHREAIEKLCVRSGAPEAHLFETS